MSDIEHVYNKYIWMESRDNKNKSFKEHVRGNDCKSPALMTNVSNRWSPPNLSREDGISSLLICDIWFQ